MKLLLAIAAAAVLFAGSSQAAPVAPSGFGQEPLVEQVKGGRGHFKGNRGRHLGWYKGRGNPHRFRR